MIGLACGYYEIQSRDVTGFMVLVHQLGSPNKLFINEFHLPSVGIQRCLELFSIIM